MTPGVTQRIAGRRTADASPLGPVSPFVVTVFYIYLTIEYVRPQDTLPVLGMLRPAMLCLIVLGLFSLSKIGTDVYRDKSIRLFIAFVCLCWVGMFHAVNTYWAFQYSLTMTMHLLAAVIPMCLIIRSSDALKKFLLFWVAAHCYLAGYALLHAGRGPGSFLGDENDLALALNVALPYAYYLGTWSGFGKGRRLVLLGAVGLIVAGVVATMSRGGFVGLAVTTVLLIWFSRHRLRNAVLVVLGAAVVFAVVPQEYKAEVQSINDTQDETRQGRIFQWGLGWDMYLDNPVLGVGTGNYPWRVHEYEIVSEDYDSGSRLHGGRAAHSMYFTLIPEQGTIGVLIFSMILWEVLKRLRRSLAKAVPVSQHLDEGLVDTAARATFVSLAAFLVTGIFISVLYYPPFWYAIGISFSIASLSSASTAKLPA